MQPTLNFGSCSSTRAWGWQPDMIQNTVHFPANSSRVAVVATSTRRRTE